MRRDNLYNYIVSSGKMSEKELGNIDEFRGYLDKPELAENLYANLKGLFSEEEIGTHDQFMRAIAPEKDPPGVRTFSEQELGLTSPQELKKQLPEQARQLSGILKDAPGYWDGEEGRDYATARNFLEDARRMMTEAGEAKERNAVGNFFRSFGREITSPDTYSFGINAIDNAGRLASISNKLEESGDDVSKLSHSEQLLLQALALRQAVEDLYSDDVSISQKAGSAVAQSLPFMVEFLATGGIGSGASAAARAGTTKLLNKLMRDGLVKRSLSAVTSQAMRQTAKKGIEKAAPWVAEKATRAAIMTPFQPTTYADIAERYVVRAGYAPNPEGGVSFDGITDRASFPEAVFKGMGSKIVTNFSEMLGEGFGKGLGVLTSQAGKKIPRLGRLMSKAEANGVYSRLSEGLKKSGWNGMVEEYMEEQAETVLNSLFIGDSQFSDLLDKERQAVTALSIAGMSGFFTAINQGGGAIRKRGIATDFRKANNALEGLGLPVEKLREIRQGIGDLTPEEQIGFIREFSTENALTRDQQQAMINYAFQANRYNGMKGGIRDQIVEEADRSAEKVREKVNPDMDAVVRARVAGYHEPVYIVGKQIGLTLQGQIDYRLSSSDVYIETPEGRKQIPITMVEEIINHTPSEQAVEAERQRIRDELARQADAEIYGDMPLSPLQPGQTLSLPQGEAVVRSVDNGRYLIEMLDDHRQVDMTEGELQALFGEDQLPVPQSSENSGAGQTPEKTQGAGMETRVGNQEISESNLETRGPESEILGGNTETGGVDLQTQVGEGENSQTGFEFPTTQAGEIGYSGISDPALYRQALESEFGEESLSVLSEMVAEVESEMKKAEKKKSAIDRARARRRASLELKKLRQVEQLFTGPTEAEIPLQIPVPVEEETPESEMPATQESVVREESLPAGQSQLTEEESPGEGAELTHVEETPGPEETIPSGESADIPRAPYIASLAITNQGNRVDKESGASDAGRQALADAEARVDTDPSPGQKEAGNHRNGHIRIGGREVTIENPKGSVRSGTDRDGKPWQQIMHHTYGYFRGVKGKDGDHVDVFLGDHLDSPWVYVVDQVNPNGAFDEHKVMYGFQSKEEARVGYLSNYAPGWQGLGAITQVSREDFERWLSSSKRKQKPFSEYVEIRKKQSGPEIRFRYGEESEGSVRFREEDSFEDVNERFNQDLEKYKELKMGPNNVFLFGRPSRNLQAAGLNDTDIFMTQRVLHSHLQKHGLSIDDLRNLPAALQDPLMVYEWGKKAKSLIVVTQIPSAEERITVAVKLERNGERLEVNEVASVHGKSIERLLSEMNDDRSDFGREKLRYVEKKKALEWLNAAMEAPLASSDSTTQELTLATKIIKEFKNPTLQEGKMMAEADNLSDRLNTPVKIIRDVNEIKEDDPNLQRRKRGSKGWYDLESGQVVVVLANTAGVDDVQKTILHEVVAHKGLREMLGRERFEGLCQDVFDMLPEKTRQSLLERYGDPSTCGEEYLATLAEQDVTPSLWQKIRARVIRLSFGRWESI